MQLILDLNKLSVEHIKLLNQIAEEIKPEFHALLEDIYKTTDKSIDWKLNNILSRNNYYSNTFIDLCYLELVKKIIVYKNIKKIKCINYQQERVLETYLKSVNSKINIEEQSLKSRIKRLRPFLTNLFIAFKQLRARSKGRQISRLKFNKIILIEIYFIESMFSTGKFKDRYYPNIESYIESGKKNRLFFLPTILLKNNYNKRINIANKSGRNFIYKFDYLKIRDYLFALFYPLRIKKINFNSFSFRGLNIEPILNYDFQSNICNSSTFEGLLNYRFFKRLKIKKINLELVINWFENQLLDKGFNLGKNKYFPNVPSIGNLGYVPLFSYKDCQLQPTALEKEMKTLPDKISVIGDAIKPMVKKFNDLNIITSPAFRFSDQYREVKNKKNKKNKKRILVALPISIIESIDIMKIVIDAFEELHNYNIEWEVRPHPSLKVNEVKNKTKSWPSLFKKSRGSFFDNIGKIDLLVGNASSTSLEALAFGVPVVVIGSLTSITQNPISEDIPSFMWDISYNVNDLCESINKLVLKINNDSKKKIINEGIKIKAKYFEPVNYKNVNNFLFNQD
jgi:hypothetical protein